MENSRWKEVQSKVIARAWKDEEFCKKLLTNPKEALKEFFDYIPAKVVLCRIFALNHRYDSVLASAADKVLVSESNSIKTNV